MTSDAAPAAGRAGRNLPVAAGVGIGLAAAVLLSLYTVTWLFVGLVVAAVAIGCWELARAVATQGVGIPLVPLVAGAAVMLVATYTRGADALAATYVLTVAAVLLARAVGPGARLRRDSAVAVFGVTYLPLLAAFAVLMAARPQGPDEVVVFILAVVMSDTGGYAAGVLFGRHKMAPSVSPKKSWEGFAGSLAGAGVATAVSVPLLLGGVWWQGLAIGLVAVLTGTLGDLTESLVKRDLGVKDMGTLIPEHGGILDRIDSLLTTAPVVAVLLALL